MKKIVSLLLCLMFSCAAFAGNTEEVKASIVKQAKELGVEPEIVLSIARTESGFNQSARSAGGHIGVFQLSPATAKHLGVNPYDVDDNIKGGITYYKNMYEKFGSMELAIAAYNAGPEAIRKNNNSIPKRTQPFVGKIMSGYKYYKQLGL